MTASTPDALWASRSVRHLRPGAVILRDLHRAVRGRRVLDGATLAVPVGARVLVASQPEEGASLLLRILAGLARADGGSIRLAGLETADPDRGGWRRRVTYLGPTRALPGWISPREALDLAASLLGYERQERGDLIERAIQRYGLGHGPGPDRPLRRGGTAFAERTALAAAVVGRPEVLLLDEPLRSLAAAERAELLGAVPRRTTILLASRLPASEAGLVNQVALLRDGRFVLHARVTELERRGLPLSMRGMEALAALADRAEVAATNATHASSAAQ
ncbi:MAG: ATP-binding cassette domain-containing protein [Chloroflexota bacterium]